MINSEKHLAHYTSLVFKS